MCPPHKRGLMITFSIVFDTQMAHSLSTVDGVIRYAGK